MSNLDDLCVWNHAEVLYKEGDEIPGYHWDESVYQGDNTKGWVFHS